MKDFDSAKTITIRISSKKEKEILKEIVKETGCKQVSKALMRTAEGYERMCKLVKSQMEENTALRAELNMYRKYADIIINTGKAMQTFKEKEGIKPIPTVVGQK